MTTFQLAAAVLTLTAALAYVNTRLLRLPSSVGIMPAMMLVLLGLQAVGVLDLDGPRHWVEKLDFGNTLLHGMLGVLGRHPPHSAKIMTWGGLRGGISIAMALALPPSGARNAIVVMTYAVVAFSVLAQGLTFGALLRRLGVCVGGRGSAG